MIRLYYDQSYFAVPEEPGRKAYHIVFIRSRKGGLTLHTMYFANEIREVAEYGKTRDIKLKPQEIKLAEQLIENLAADFFLLI